MLAGEEETKSEGGETAGEAPPAKPARRARSGGSVASEPKAAKAEKRGTIEEIVAAVKNLTVLELSHLVKTLEAEFGVTAAAPVVAAAVAAPAAAPVEAAEEKTEFSVILKEIGPNKISVIRAVRELTSLGLKESKDLVEGAPKPVKEGVSKEEAAAAKKKLEEAGATVEVA